MKFTIKHLFLAILLVSLALVGWGVYQNYQFHLGDGANTARLELALKELRETDPGKDAAERIGNGEFRFAGCWGEPGGPYFPGVPQSDWQGIRDSKQFWVFEGTTDALESGYHHSLVDRAWIYARRYNKALHRIIHDDGR